MNDEELNGALAKLRVDYAEQLPVTVAQMEDLWQRLVSAEIPPSKLADLARMAHSIAGSGTTFGLPAASLTARELELFLDKFTESGCLPGLAEQARVSALLAVLRQPVVQG